MEKYLATAACLVLILAGAVALPRLIEPEGQGPDVVTVPSIVEAGSLQELSQQIGFEVTERFDLPFNAEETSYMSYWGELAELHYSGEEQTAVYRQSIGTEDNSGDYDAYKDVTEITVNEMNITLKGNDGIYTLAVWTDGEYSYSLSLSSGVSENSWRSSLSH